MERQITNHDQNPHNPGSKPEQSPRKQPISGGGGGSSGGDHRLKRDEWSEGAVSSLLEAYESKWVLRNRAKLKGQDWEDVAKHVSFRSHNTKSPKTPTQCKNKIESMKKRYRSESATSDTSSWPLFSRLDTLLRGTGGPTCPPPAQQPSSRAAELVLESAALAQVVPPPPPPPHQPPVEIAQNNSHESDGVDLIMAKEDDHEVAAKLSDQVQSDKNQNEHDHLETDSSTPGLYSNDKDGQKSKKMKMMMMKRRSKRRREDHHSSSSSWEDVAESIRWLADAVVRSEQARMDTMRELERMRVEAEAKRGEMDLKRTEIIANTQLEIARIFASTAGKSIDSSLKIGRS